MKISIVIPVYNESSNVFFAQNEIVKVLKSDLPDLDFEIIFVDDGSRDDSFEQLTELCRKYSYIRVIKLANNCGAHMAIRVGLERARGDCACFLACDLQDPPNLIPQMLKSLNHSAQIVWAVRNNRQDNISSRLFSFCFYKLARLFVSKNIPPTGASMFLLGKSALKAVRLFPERNLTLEGLFATMGFQHSYIEYNRQKRNAGESKWGLSKRLKLFADFFVGYSYTPLRLMSYLGICIAALGFIYAVFIIFNRLFYSNPIEGWSSLMIIVIIMGGLQMIMLGVMGEYIWRTLDEARQRPKYIIEAILEDGVFDNHQYSDLDQRKNKGEQL